MKTKIKLTLLIISLPLSLLLAQEKEAEVIKKSKQIEKSMEEWEDEMEEWSDKVEIAIEVGQPPPHPPMIRWGKNSELGNPKLGLYLDDLTFKEAYELHYPHNYGVLIDGVTSGGNARRAGLREGDIIMTFDGEKVLSEDHLLSLRDSKAIGDSVAIDIFRNEKELVTVLFFASTVQSSEEEKKKSTLSAGYGGGGPMIVQFNSNIDKLNQFLVLNGFSPVNPNKLVAFGGFGMGTIGKGWFIGGAGAGMSIDQQIPDADGFKIFKLDMGYGGVTLTKKIPIRTEKIVLDLGMLLGAGSTEILMNHTDGSFSWDDDFTQGTNYSIHFKKEYFVFMPTVGLLIRIKDWVGIHAAYSYLGTYSGSEKWKDEHFSFDVVGDTPPVPGGQNISLGVWFGY